MFKNVTKGLLIFALLLQLVQPALMVGANESTEPTEEETTTIESEESSEPYTDVENGESVSDDEDGDDASEPTDEAEGEGDENETSALTIEELGNIIVSAGAFWDEWWRITGRFAHEMIDWYSVHPHGIYHHLLPASGFTSLTDIRAYLSQHYTSAWIDRELTGQFPRFVTYDGNLFVHTARAGFPRPMWETASHVLVEQEGERSVVDTTVMMFAGDEMTAPFEKTYRFTLYNRLIDEFQEELNIAPPNLEPDVTGLTQATIDMMYAFIENNTAENPFVIPTGLTFNEAINLLDWGAGVTVGTPMSGLEAPEGTIWGGLVLELNRQAIGDGTYDFDDYYWFLDIGLFIEYEALEDETESEPPTEETTAPSERPGLSLPQMGTTAFNVALIGIGILIVAGILVFIKRKK